MCDIIFIQTYTCSYRDLFDHKYLAMCVDIQYMARSQMREGPICSTTSKLIFVSSTQTK